MDFQDIAFLPSLASFYSLLKKIVVEVIGSGWPHVLELWLGLGKGMLSAKHFAPTNYVLCVSGMS